VTATQTIDPPKPSARRPALLGAAPAFSEDVFVTRPLIPDGSRYNALASEILESHWLTNDGPKTRELERRLAERLGVAYCASFCNGTAALLTALRALDLEGEVITTPFTFPATPHCIEWNHLTPVFCDVDPATYNLDPVAVEAAITERTCAIVPVHVFGNPCDVEAFQAISERHGLPIVYDAAHAFGVELNGRPIGQFGTLSALSFHATKVFHTVEGGAVVSGDPAQLERLALLRNFGIVNENTVRGVGLNGKLSELHAAMGLLVLEELDAEITRRGELAGRYRARLESVPGFSFQRVAQGVHRNHFNFTVSIEPDAFGLTRDEVHAALKMEHIVSRKYFYPLCSENECYSGLASANPAHLPNAIELSERILSLPLYGDLASDDVDHVVDALLSLAAHAPQVRTALTEAAL
jgi:dTDP-4-amino-4,6-dideoxygalactose transaminase